MKVSAKLLPCPFLCYYRDYDGLCGLFVHTPECIEHDGSRAERLVPENARNRSVPDDLGLYFVRFPLPLVSLPPSLCCARVCVCVCVSKPKRVPFRPLCCPVVKIKHTALQSTSIDKQTGPCGSIVMCESGARCVRDRWNKVKKNLLRIILFFFIITQYSAIYVYVLEREIQQYRKKMKKVPAEKEISGFSGYRRIMPHIIWIIQEHRRIL